MKAIGKVSFLGLGVMGGPMAGHLTRQFGATVTVYNRTGGKADAWLTRYPGEKGDTPASAAEKANIIFTCVGNDDDLRAVLTGPNGVIEGIGNGAVIVDHSTVSADVSQEMAGVFEKKSCYFLDAPVSGGQKGAEDGKLTIMVGGDQAAFDYAAPVMRAAYGREVRRMGGPGAGQLTKMVNQIAIGGVLQGLSEALAFGRKAGLDMEEVLAVIGKGAAQSWQMDNRGLTMLKDEFDFGFSVEWMIKDLKIVLDEAKRNGAALPLTADILERYKKLQANGDGRKDTSALIRLLP